MAFNISIGGIVLQQGVLVMGLVDILYWPDFLAM